MPMLYVTANIPKSVDSRKRAMTREFRKSRKTRCLTGSVRRNVYNSYMNSLPRSRRDQVLRPHAAL